MRALSIGLVTVACLVLPVAAQARCSPPTGKVLSHTAQVVVYTHKIKVRDGRQTDAFACRVATGATRAFVDRSLLLAQYDVEIPRATVAIGGLFAGAVVNIGTGSRGGPQITVIDLRPKHPRVSYTGDPGGYTVTALVLSSHGNVAWIAGVPTANGRTSYEVAVGMGRSKRHVLDSSRKISPRSLRLSGSSLSWSDGGQTRTATL